MITLFGETPPPPAHELLTQPGFDQTAAMLQLLHERDQCVRVPYLGDTDEPEVMMILNGGGLRQDPTEVGVWELLIADESFRLATIERPEVDSDIPFTLTAKDVAGEYCKSVAPETVTRITTSLISAADRVLSDAAEVARPKTGPKHRGWLRGLLQRTF